mmetsp:Transcript_3679/g.7695  ORF Transcript_3679/g.7695 Transcript_3679/m.7695 type:complete len:661 (+) Transcript_3679:56-2038(+)|eukprot:CAMPEP_0172530588 /NCGR_PEP_ID=MMETSP1067-20121228/4278_1 /TAXON_ID=265564 ORGANISM="Thalassiosira punctigera, Strain Tpunct2005C2" /NCGR_SAMPLE_ID=MMETSP1067 /ASSEMBLY_ACC=CAM_ASM_000444 /LENGTH=660 /DNA_ID=CAMNT_0013314829 /DNA_START=30 /DNA_END=2009 /DNA_ORIENTATION=+
MQQATTRLSLAILLAATFNWINCLALSPLLSGSAAAGISTNDGPAPRSKNVLHRRDDPRSTARGPLSMAGGGGEAFSPEPEGPKQTRWADYVTSDLEAPTITEKEPTPTAQLPARPKIVVFGASGRVGRRVVRKLLSSGADLDVVAFVRDAKKLERVLYDEEDLVMENLMESNDGGAGGEGSGRGGRGPRLKVVVSDVVSRRDLYRGDFETDDERRALDLWVDRAKRYFASRGWTTNNVTNSFESDDKAASDVDVLESGGEEALKDAVAGSSVLVSCLATSRLSNLWTDYLRVPVVRVFRRDASRWSSDPAHPYYVNYLSTKKILDEAEREQRRRDDALRALEEERRLKILAEERKGGGREEEGFESKVAARLQKMRKKRRGGLRDGIHNRNLEGAVPLPETGRLPSSADRIKFIRISHLMVGHNPFRVWNAITNILWSQPSRFELMGEMLMEASETVDTIVLRPGELTDDERNSNHTSLQLCIDGRVQYPSLVGREDVADLAVVSALTKTNLNGTEFVRDDADTASRSRNDQLPSAHHYTWAVRWTGQHLSPPQGLRPDGLSSAALCFVKAIKDQINVDSKMRRREKSIQSYHGGKELIRLKRWSRRLKPLTQSLAISIPVYATLGLLGWCLFGQAFADAYLRLKRLHLPQILLKLISS